MSLAEHIRNETMTATEEPSTVLVIEVAVSVHPARGRGRATSDTTRHSIHRRFETTDHPAIRQSVVDEIGRSAREAAEHVIPMGRIAIGREA